MKPKRLTYKELEESRQYYAQRESDLLATYESKRAKFEAEKREWLESKDRRLLTAKVDIARASSAMIEALARMIGGGGF